MPELVEPGVGPDVPLCIDDSLIDLLRSRPRTVVVTGAGVSAESGIPTFRDAMTGLWARYSPERS